MNILIIEKFALIIIDRKDGPKISKIKGFNKSVETNLLLYALPIGGPYNGVFKYIEITGEYYCSYLEINNNNNGVAAVIAISFDNLKFNPFSINSTLIQKVP